MSDLLAARAQMAMSLMFHIVFAVAGMAMPLMMVIAEWRWLRTRDRTLLLLAKQWAKGTASQRPPSKTTSNVPCFAVDRSRPRHMPTLM